MGSFSMSTFPELGLSRPAMSESRVVLPLPLTPLSTTHSPFSIVRLMSFKTGTLLPAMMKGSIEMFYVYHQYLVCHNMASLGSVTAIFHTGMRTAAIKGSANIKNMELNTEKSSTGTKETVFCKFCPPKKTSLRSGAPNTKTNTYAINTPKM